MLTTLNIANSVLQVNASNLPSAIEMIEECRSDINDFRNAYSLDKIEKDLDTMKSMYSDHDNTQGRGKRQSSLPQRLIGTVMDERIPSQVQRDPDSTDLRQTVVGICDVLGEELSQRFNPQNTSAWGAMHALSPESETFFDSDALLPLYEYAKTAPIINEFWNTNGVSESLLNAECRLFKSKIEKFHKEGKQQGSKVDPLNNITSELLKFFENNNTPIILPMLYKMAVTAGYSQCRVECYFSAVTRVDSSHRRSQLTYHKASLAYLHFSKELTRKVTFEEFSTEWKKKPRSLNF